jgi:hypothetical protein
MGIGDILTPIQTEALTKEISVSDLMRINIKKEPTKM